MKNISFSKSQIEVLRKGIEESLAKVKADFVNLFVIPSKVRLAVVDDSVNAVDNGENKTFELVLTRDTNNGKVCYCLTDVFDYLEDIINIGGSPTIEWVGDVFVDGEWSNYIFWDDKPFTFDVLKALEIEEPTKLEVDLDTELHDGEGETGGIAFTGETLRDFLLEVGLSGRSSKKEINDGLVECGIAPLD